MNSLLTFLNGKKTYIVVALAVVTAGLQAYGITIPEWVYALEGAAGLGAVRVAISNSAPAA
jgi:hypothetical protein